MKQIVLLSMVIALCVSCGQKDKYTYDPDKIKSDTTGIKKSSETWEIDFKTTESNVKTVHVRFNDANGYDAILDTGCSGLLISSLEFVDMLKMGTISEDDFVGTTGGKMANGTSMETRVYNIREIAFVDKKGKSHTLNNVQAQVVNVQNVEQLKNADILIGNEIIDNLAKHSYEVDLSNKVIRFN